MRIDYEKELLSVKRSHFVNDYRGRKNGCRDFSACLKDKRYGTG